MGTIASQITSLTIVYSMVYSDADQRKQQSSASLAFVRGIRRGPVNSPHKWPVTRKMFPFDDVIMSIRCWTNAYYVDFNFENHSQRQSLRMLIFEIHITYTYDTCRRFLCILLYYSLLLDSCNLSTLKLWRYFTWWRHQMETFSALLTICAENSPVPGEFPARRPVTRSFDVFFDLRLNKRLRKQSWGW